MAAPPQPVGQRSGKRPRTDTSDFSSLAITANVPKSFNATTSGPSNGVAPTIAPDWNTLAALDTAGNWNIDLSVEEDWDPSNFSFTFTNSSRDSSAFLNRATVDPNDLYANPPPRPGDTGPASNQGGGAWDMDGHSVVRHDRGDSFGSSSSSQPPRPANAESDASSPPTKTSRCGPTEQEWTERQPLIQYLYSPDGANLKLAQLMTAMEIIGFLKSASADMYKKRFVKWGIFKNDCPAKRRQAAQSQKSKTPPPMAENQLTLKIMFEHIRSLCVKSIQEKRWALENDLCVVDDDWEGAYGDAAALIKKLAKDPSLPDGWEAIRNGIEPMVQHLNFFSLPTTLIIAFKMCKELKEPLAGNRVGEFLRGCLQIAQLESGRSTRHGNFVKVLEGLCKISEGGTKKLKETLELTIPFCVHVSNDYAGSRSATALSLLTFYHAQLQMEPGGMDLTLQGLQLLLRRAEKDKGKEHRDTIEILGLVIMALQITGDEEQLRWNCGMMRRRADRGLKESGGDPQRTTYYLNCLLDALHLEIRLLSKRGTRDSAERIRDLEEDYKKFEEEYQKEKDGYSQILDVEVEEVMKLMENSSLGG